MTRFLACGDLHLDKGGRYGRVPGERLAEQEVVWARILEIAREEGVDAVLFAGDAFEKRHPSTDALLAFERPLIAHREVLSVGRALVYAIPGNHDRSGVSDYCALDVFNEAGMIYLHSRPAVMLGPGGVSIAFLPWAPVSRIVAAEGGGDRDDVNAVAAELLLETARGLRSQIEGPAVLLTHFSISGAALPGGVLTDQLREPVLPVEELEAIGFDAIVAGHIHRPQLLGSEDAPGPIFYTGSPMALDFGEGKDEHGVWLLDFDFTPTSFAGTQFLPIASRRFATLDDDLTLGTVSEEVGAQIIAERRGEIDGAYVKIRYTATEEQARRIDHEQIRRDAFEAGAHAVWIEPTVVRETRSRVEGIDETVDDTAALEAWLESQSVNGSQAPALRDLHRDYIAEVGS